jgi:hypothetical protein
LFWYKKPKAVFEPFAISMQKKECKAHNKRKTVSKQSVFCKLNDKILFANPLPFTFAPCKF